MKKTLILIIFFIFILSIAPPTTYAINFDDIKNKPSEEAVDLLSSYNIISGYPDNTFRPDKSVTRAEMAKIITVTAGYYEYTKNMESKYEDMDGHWAERYVELANIFNIVKGTSDKTYEPDKIITYNEAITMIIRLLGYTDESLPGKWPSDYYIKAEELNLFDNVSMSSAYASRGDIAIMLYNSLNCELVKVKNTDQITKTNKSLLSVLGKKITKEITVNDLNLNDGFNYTNYLFNKWDVYYNLNGEAVYITNPRYNEYNGTVTSLLSNKVIFVTDNSGNVKAFKLLNIPIVFNGAVGDFKSLENSKIKVVYEDNSYNGEVVGVIAQKTTDMIVIDKNNLYKTGSIIFANKNLPTQYGYQINVNKINIYGDASRLEEIKENDLVYFYETSETSSYKSTVSLEVIRSNIQGVITNIETKNSITYYTINNKTYKTSDDFIFTESASIKDNAKFILDKENNIIKLFILSYGKLPTTYGIVLSSTNNTNNLPSIRILDEYGNINNYYLSENSSVVNASSNNSSTEYSTNLKRNDFIKFYPPSQGSLKIIEKKPIKNISSYYNEYTGQISTNNYKITSNTFIVYEKSGKYKFLNPYELDNYIEGVAYINYNGNVDMLYLTNGLKSNDVVKPNVPVDPSHHDKTLLGIINVIKKIDENKSEVIFFNYNESFTISNSSYIGKNISSYMNSYVKIVISNGEITKIERVIAETDKIKISEVYSNQLQIDGITYIEYSTYVKVYICKLNQLGNISSVEIGTKSDIVANSIAQLYDADGKFDGIIDVILLFE